jgi:hypothetical protein
MFDSKVAKYAASISWRFVVSGFFVMLVLVQFVPVGLSPEQLKETPLFMLTIPLAQIIWVYSSMYLALLWVSFTPEKSSKSVENL